MKTCSKRRNIKRLLLLLLMIVLLLNRFTLIETGCQQPNHALEQSNNTKSNRGQKERLADGCFHVFIDVGANVGVHGRFLYEPDKYNLSKFAVPLFEKKFGRNRLNKEYCVLAIEANPKHWDRLDAISIIYRSFGWRFIVVKAAAFDEGGSGTFFHQGDGRFNEWGFSLKFNKAKKPKSTVGTESVPLIRFSKWLQHEIFERTIPSQFHSRRKPVVGMKMDIEGSEFIVLPDLLASGALCKIDFLFGELHPWLAPLNFSDQSVSLENESDASRFFEAFELVLRSSRKCRTEFIPRDDEKYLHDTVPLPDGQF
mmetsp:Transcript_45686/g.110695  ORF Transcript_45686/g.110695 Transcript_45686/m.110695 type:complete len:312 (-) Transcript_45686:81-1016(-)